MFGFILRRPLLWSGLAVGVLVLDHYGMLNNLSKLNTLFDASAPQVSQEVVEAELARAEDRARKFLPRYLADAMRGPGSWDTKALLVAFEKDGAQERLWVENFRPAEGTGFTGVLTNDASLMPDLSRGSEVSFDLAEVVDWSYVKDGVGYGYFTVHAKLPYMDPARAEFTKEFLHDTPLPQGW